MSAVDARKEHYEAVEILGTLPSYGEPHRHSAANQRSYPYPAAAVFPLRRAFLLSRI